MIDPEHHDGPPPAWPDEARGTKPARKDHALTFRAASELTSTPTPHAWLVRSLFELGSLVLVFGDAASAKTWLVLSWAVHVAAGLPWFGHATKPGAVFIIAGEGLRGIGRRLAGLSRHYGIELEGLPIYVSDRATALADQVAVAELIECIRSMAAEAGEAPVLVILDTLSRNYGPGDENSTADAAAVVAALDWIKDEFGAAVLVVHHVGHGDRTRARGSTVLRGALDTEFRVVKDEAGVIELACTKMKDAEAPAPQHFMLADVMLDWRDEDGQPVRSAAIVPTEAPPPAAVSSSGLGRRQLEALRLLIEEYARRRENLHKGGHDGTTAKVEMDYWREALRGAGFTRQQVWKVTSGLQARGAIRLVGPHVLLTSEDAPE